MRPLRSTVRQRLLFILIHLCFIDFVYATPYAIVNISLRSENIVVVSCLSTTPMSAKDIAPTSHRGMSKGP